MDFMAIFQQNKIVFIFMGLIIIGTFIFNSIRMKKMKSSNQDFLRDHPNAAKVYLTTRALITSEAVTVITVDDEAPRLFMEKTKTGFYALPGTRTVQMQYAYNRPGVLYKNVMTSYGPVKKELAIDAGKSYILGFDRKAETFTFAETGQV